MNLLTKITLGTVILAGFVLGVYLLLLRPTGPSSPSEFGTFPSGTQGGGSAQTEVATSAQTPATAADVEQEYERLLEKLSAKRINFVSVDSTAGELGSVYALYATDIKVARQLFPAAKEFPISIALVDLNYDGVEEAVVFEDLPGFCGSGGCTFDVYRKEKGKWVNIFSAVAGENAAISTVVRGTYVDLYLFTHGGLGYLTQAVRYEWTGSGYEAKASVAMWDGSQFLTR